MLAVEIQSRTESAVRQRIRDAHFPETKTFDTFYFTASEGIDAVQIADLSRGRWIADAENLIFAGPIGTGKTHLAIAVGLEMARLRKRVAFWRAADLVRTLLEARDTRELTRIQRRMTRVDLLILDELGFFPFVRTGGELLFNLVAERYERRFVLAPATWPSASGPRSSVTTRSSQRRCSTAWPTTPPSSPRKERASGCGADRDPRASPRQQSRR